MMILLTWLVGGELCCLLCANVEKIDEMLEGCFEVVLFSVPTPRLCCITLSSVL